MLINYKISEDMFRSCEYSLFQTTALFKTNTKYCIFKDALHGQRCDYKYIKSLRRLKQPKHSFT